MQINLIPRYNWDYSLKDLFFAYKSLLETSEINIIGKYLGSDPIFTTSGRASLFAILKSLYLPEGSKIGVPLFCCPIVFETIEAANLKPEFIDIDLENYCLSLTDYKAKINDFKAVIVVNLFGNPVNIKAIKSLYPEIIVIEDCAQSLFSKYNGYYTGTLSDVSFFSFRLGKYLSSGEGSIIICNNNSLKEKIENIVAQFENWSFFDELTHPAICFGKSLFYHKPLFGMVGLPIGKILDNNFNITNKRGVKPRKISRSDYSLINNKIMKLQSHKDRQRENSLFLLEEIKFPSAVLPFETSDSYYNYLFFPIRFINKADRDFVYSFLFESGIDTGKYLENIRELIVEYSYQNNCPNSELCSDTVLTIPNYYTLKRKELEHIANSINKAGNLIGEIHAN